VVKKMRHKGARKAVLFLVSVALASVVLGGVAVAKFQGFESDMSQDSVVNVCNRDDVRSKRVTTAIERWNAVTAQWGKPTLREAGPDAFCEVKVEELSDEGSPANFYARLEFGTHPDTLQISPRFRELTIQERQAVITHEFGHVLGLAHPPADKYHCLNSVMTTMMDCHELGVERRDTPGTYDEAELKKYWVEELTYPIKNKCWTTKDLDPDWDVNPKDGKCDRFGPPGDSIPQTMRAAQRAGATLVEAPPNPVN
jgi:hypothetical protein